jgi:hypothetical protein
MSPGVFVPMGLTWLIIAVIRSSPVYPTADTIPLRFSVRDLMWFTLVVGLAVAWWLRSQQYMTLEQSASVSKVKLLQEQLRAANIYADFLQTEALASRHELERVQKLLEVNHRQE